MLKNKMTRCVVIGAAVLAVAAGAAVTSTANAANQPNGSQGAMYIGSGNTGAHVPAGTTSAFTDGNFGYGDRIRVVAFGAIRKCDLNHGFENKNKKARTGRA